MMSFVQAFRGLCQEGLAEERIAKKAGPRLEIKNQRNMNFFGNTDRCARL